MEAQKKGVRDAYEEYYERVMDAIKAIKDSKFNAPGWLVWMAYDDLPEDEGDNDKKKM